MRRKRRAGKSIDSVPELGDKALVEVSTDGLFLCMDGLFLCTVQGLDVLVLFAVRVLRTSPRHHPAIRSRRTNVVPLSFVEDLDVDVAKRTWPLGDANIRDEIGLGHVFRNDEPVYMGESGTLAMDITAQR